MVTSLMASSACKFKVSPAVSWAFFPTFTWLLKLKSETVTEAAVATAVSAPPLAEAAAEMLA